MTSRSPARWLAPIALLASVLAVLLILAGTVGLGGDDAEPAAETPTTEARETGARDRPAGDDGAPARTTAAAERGPRTYRVRPGDTLGAIAERTGLTVERLVALNPDTDPQSLTVGETLRLRGSG